MTTTSGAVHPVEQQKKLGSARLSSFRTFLEGLNSLREILAHFLGFSSNEIPFAKIQTSHIENRNFFLRPPETQTHTISKCGQNATRRECGNAPRRQPGFDSVENRSMDPGRDPLSSYGTTRKEQTSRRKFRLFRIRPFAHMKSKRKRMTTRSSERKC